MRRALMTIGLLVLVSAALAGVASIVFGQTAPAPAQHPAQAQKPKPAATPATPGSAAAATGDNQNVLPSRRTSRCVSEGRAANLDCAVEQSAVVSQTGQLLASITVRVPADTRRPMLLLQLPVGLFLPAGITVQVDAGAPQQIALQTCDLKGCYAGAALSDEMLGAMKTGTRFAIAFQNVAKENIVIPFGLSNFAETYQRIQ
jgi:invasion protein IalB